MFVNAGFNHKCAIVTSYVPNPSDISKEDSGEGATEKLRQYEIYRRMLSDFFGVPADQAVGRIDEFETEVKRRFIEEPGQMRLLIVVDKLLTGFDAPSATYLYIDKPMHDHGLFQAICRVNRLDGKARPTGMSSTTGTCSSRWSRPSPTTPPVRSTNTRRTTSKDS